MRIELIRTIFTNEQLQQQLLAGEAQNGNDAAMAQNMRKCLKDEHTQQYVHQFIACIESQKGTQLERATSFLLTAFLKDIKKEEGQIPEALQRSIDKVAAVYKKEPITSPGTFTGHELPISKFLPIAEDYYDPLEIETLLKDHATQDPVMQERLKARDERHLKAFSYDVLTTSETPKLIVCGTPREDRANCLADFYKMLVQEECDVVVALNTFSDWTKAIPYYDEAVLKALQVTVESVKILYKGTVATNLPKKLREKGVEVALDDDSLDAYRVRIEERRIRVEVDGKVRTISHLHYINWPDHKAAPDEIALELLLKRHMDLGGLTSVIHCQGGIGRTLGYVQHLYFRHIINREYQQEGTINNLGINIAERTYGLMLQAPRLGGFPKPDRMAQVLRMTHKYAEQFKG